MQEFGKKIEREISGLPANGHVSFGLFKVGEKKETVTPTVADDGEV